MDQKYVVKKYSIVANMCYVVRPMRIVSVLNM